jgi:(E)-4-hydroxy-3-methylbut-2-enyl-diphosphate synthase
MVHAYRLLIQQMQNEFGESYPLHLGVTEAGDGEDGRIKSAIGIGTLLEDGIGDTIRVSLTEDPELEIPVCRDIVKRYNGRLSEMSSSILPIQQVNYNPFEYKKRASHAVVNIGGTNVPVVVADMSSVSNINASSFQAIGYDYNEATDKWNIADAAADYVFVGDQTVDFEIPGTLKVVVPYEKWTQLKDDHKYAPLFNTNTFIAESNKSNVLNFVMLDAYSTNASISDEQLVQIAKNPTVVFCIGSDLVNAMQAVRRMIVKLNELQISNPIILSTLSKGETTDEHLIHFATETGAILLDGMGDGIWLSLIQEVNTKGVKDFGRNYVQNNSIEQFLNATAFGILQATRTRISKTEYISCPSCGRTLFELQETTAKIRKVTNHLKGLKIAIMGCIVNGPGEMADADFGYVGSGVGKITLYKGKEVMKRNIDSEVAVDELIQLLKDHNAWMDPQ